MGFVKKFYLVTILGLTLVGLLKCYEDNKTPSQSGLWAKYIKGHTSGLISKKSSIYIQFLNDVIDEKSTGTNAESYIEITPQINGIKKFINTKEIIIIPKNSLVQGKKYTVELKANKLIKIPEELGNYKFTFNVIKQQYEVNILNLETNENNNKIMNLKGDIITADIEDYKKVEKMLSCSYLNDKININWIHKDKKHEFIIKNIKKQTKIKPITLSWIGSPINVHKSGLKKISIPAINTFDIINTKTVTQGNQRYIAVYFSDNIDKKQNLKGLIRVKDKKFTTAVVKNAVRVYLDKKPTGPLYLISEPGIKNTDGVSIKKRYKKTLFFSSKKPEVKFVGKGVILPKNKVLSIPFEAINVKSVQVTAFLVYENNMGYFLQTNKLYSSNNISRVGRYLWRKTIYLPFVKGDTWSRYYLDATKLFKNYPNGLFRLSLSINRANSIYTCSKEDNDIPILKEPPIKNAEDLYLTEPSSWDYAENYYNQQNTVLWVDRNNPCKDAYFKHKKEAKNSKNFLASNIGIIAKMGTNKKVHVVTTAIDSVKPLNKVKLSIMNFQNQLMAKSATDNMGFAEISLSNRPFYIVAEKDGQKGYLKMTKGTALPTSHFEVGGEAIKAGIKGFIYGERGVWRPGDNIYLTFVLQDNKNSLPIGYPVTMRFFNPRGQLIHTIKNTNPVDRFYSFKLKTDNNAPTGNWTAKANIGINTFTKKIKVETIVPNRLKVLLDFGKKAIYTSDMPIKGKIFGQWLHGATASGLKTDVSLRFSPVPTKFNIFTDYNFDDSAREFRGESSNIFEGKLDNKGNAWFTKNITPETKPPGNLTAYFKTRIFESGGAFSSNNQSFTYYPYKNYVGIKLPKGDQKRNMLLTNKVHTVSIASISDKGRPVSLRKVKVSLYKISWKWWWNKSKESLAKFISSTSTNLIKENTISTRKGLGKWKFKIKYPSWGRYLIRTCSSGGHCSSKVFYIDWPGWAGRAKEQKGAGANVLNFSSNKRKYRVGDTAVIKLPKVSQGQALMTIENGSKVISKKWIRIKKANNKFSIRITKNMLPNVYISLFLIQPHKNKRNDRPIRLYGVIPIKVYDPNTELKPIISTSDKWKAESKVSIRVSEAKNREMIYTLAIVDEGLLGLTNFKTPKLHKAFYKKEALGVNYWDIYDSVVGAYGRALERLLSIGGDDFSKKEESKSSKRRFPPVVKYIGPFKLNKGEKKRHKIVLPQYIGALRIMVVAGRHKAYGSAEKSVIVKKPLAILSTLPRVIGPSENLTIPVNVFVSEDNIKNVTLGIRVNKHFEIIESSSFKLRFNRPGEKMAFINLKVKDKIGKGKVVLTAKSNGHTTSSTTFIDVRSPNPKTIRQFKMSIPPNEAWEQNINPHGIAGTNEVFLETSIIPPLNLEYRVDFLVKYPHGCVEQITSALFPQIFLPSLVNMDKKKKKEIEGNIGIGIERLQQFQNVRGGFFYWPGEYWGRRVNDWITSYVGHFLLEADKLGYYVPKNMITKWISYQKTTAKRWYKRNKYSVLVQSYRLYTLALASKADIGAMNRLKALVMDNSAERYLLASAYNLAGLPSIARNLTKNVSQYMIADYKLPGNTFGSTIRDKAIILSALVIMKDNNRARALVEEISKNLASDKWYSTHSISYALLAVSKFIGIGKSKTSLSFEKTIGSTSPNKVSTDKPIHSIKLLSFSDKGEVVKVKNTSSKTIYANIVVKGIPKAGEENYTSSGLRINVDYKDNNGNSIDVDNLKQGTDFTANVIITNTSDNPLQNIALSHIIPSGWQISNTRLSSNEGIRSKIDYQDIRDDRVYSYFSLKKNESKTIPIKLNASFLGRYYLPGISVEPMYNAFINARIIGKWVKVVK